MGIIFACYDDCLLCVSDQFSLFPLCLERQTTVIPTTLFPTPTEETTEPPTTTPSTFQPSTTTPSTQEPTTEIPTTQAPTTEMPTETQILNPSTQEPTTEIPTTQAPTTEMPTEIESTLIPTTNVPTPTQQSTCDRILCPNSRPFCFIYNNESTCNECQNSSHCISNIEECVYNSTLGYHSCSLLVSTSTPQPSNLTIMDDLNTIIVRGSAIVSRVLRLSSNSSLYLFPDESYNNQSEAFLKIESSIFFDGHLYVMTQIPKVRASDILGSYNLIECINSLCNGSFKTVSMGFIPTDPKYSCKDWIEQPNYSNSLFSITINPTEDSCESKSSRWKLIVILACVISFIFFISFLLSYIFYKYKRKKEEKKWNLLAESINLN